MTVIDAEQVNLGAGGGAGLVVVCVAVWWTTTWWVVVGTGRVVVVVVGTVVVTGGGFDVVTTDAGAELIELGTARPAAVGSVVGAQAVSRTTPPPAQSTPAQRNNDLDTRNTLSRTIAETDSGYVAKSLDALHPTISRQFLAKRWTRTPDLCP
ncbi:MAG TPA: hypothetical protein VFW65_21950 [Pseudonocardiaceae bacterium]|nr:hypothetical protein [Pseudonocardiaceae bacterium]